jgi:hypothetical protein
MKIKRFSMSVGFAAALATAAVASATAAPARPGNLHISTADGAVVLVQSVKERPLEELPPVDAGRTPPPSTRANPPAPVPPAPRVSTRSGPTPADDESRPPAREVPPPPTSTSRVTPPPPPARYQEPTPIHRAAPRGDDAPPATAAPSRRAAPPAYEEPPPPRRADTTRRTPSTRPQERSAFYSNCTQQCHLSCEASFEACNGDSSPAKPACVKKLESCRIERCACRFD